MSSDSISIRFFWPTSRSTWWAWTILKLWEFPLYLLSCLLYGLIASSVLYITLLATSDVDASYRRESSALSGLSFSLILLFTKPVLDLIIVMVIVGFTRLLSELMETLRNLLTEAIVFGCLLTLNYYQASKYKEVFAVTAGLQIFGFCLLALSADFDTPLKQWLKSRSSTKFRRFLARFLKLKYFQCSNPIQEKVFTTHLFFTNGELLNSSGFELDTFAELDRSSTGKVSVVRAGPYHIRFKVEGVARNILVEASQRNDKQKEILEYIAHHPEAAFVKEVRGFRGTYSSLEEYSSLLNSEDIYVCRFPKAAAIFTQERNLELFPWMGKYRKHFPKWCEKFVGSYVRYTGVFSPLESPPLIEKRLYFAQSIVGFGCRISWRSATASDGVVMF